MQAAGWSFASAKPPAGGPAAFRWRALCGWTCKSSRGRVARLTFHTDPAKALEAAGLSE